jgi:uroporphyrinogen III methyltransferase/synthase
MIQPSTPSGFVTLVGAGPGDPGLLTLAGRDALVEADVILYDRLANAELLNWARPECLKIPVGKFPGCHPVPQEQINDLLIEHAHRGSKVVRLKGGDPYVFGRGGEEVSALRAHGIPFRVIPGVSSAIAAPAAIGIPVTDRRCAGSFRVITGNFISEDGVGGLAWTELAASKDTLIVLMGHATLSAIAQGLMGHGMTPNTPAALIQAATTPQQKFVTGVLGNICQWAGQSQLGRPAVLVLGEVVRLSVENQTNKM